MNDSTQLIEDIDSLKALLEDAAQAQKDMDEGKYRTLKSKLSAAPRILPLLPSFLKSRSSLTSFRSLTQKFPHYAERQTFIEQGFEPALSFLYDELENLPSEPERYETVVEADTIDKNALRLLSIMVQQQLQQVTNSELQELSGIEDPYDVNDALEQLEEMGAVEVQWIQSVSSTLAFGDVKLKGKGKSMIQNAQANILTSSVGTTLIIHGHDETNLLRLKNFLTSKLGIPEPMVMQEQTTPGKTMPEKFETLAEQVSFAIALMTPDDEGRAKSEHDLKDRCRQNVITEIGWFWGKLGREHILLLVKEQVEMPSDLQGLEYFKFTDSVAEVSEKIRDFYKAHGVEIK